MNDVFAGQAKRDRVEIETIMMGRSRQAAAISWLREAALLPVIVLLIIVGSFVNSAFFAVSNFTGIGQQIAALGAVTVGESPILLIGGMDLSLEGTFGLAPMVAAWLMVPVATYGLGLRLNPLLAIGALLAVGAVVGIVNGLLIVKARLKVDRIRIGVYVAGSVLAAVGGLMEAGRVSAVTGQQGYQEGIIFSVFAAAVIGGVSLKGGRGNMVGAASGVVLLGLVQNILDLSQVSNYWIEAVTGGVILVALVLARIVGGEASAE